MTAFSGKLRALLAPQERFERLRDTTMFRAGRSLCDLGYANPYEGVLPQVRQILQDTLASDRSLGLQYSPYGGATVARRAIADKLTRTHGAPFAWRDVVLTPGAMAALCVAFRCIDDADHEGEVLVITPCWMDYFLYLENLGIKWRAVSLNAEHRLDIAAIRAALRPATRAVVMSQPANPTGVLYTAAELQELAAVLREQACPPLWISDECHRDMLFEGREFTSPATLYPRTCVIYSFGKSLFMQGLRMGYLAVSSAMPDGAAFAADALRAVRAMGFCGPNALMQLALPRLLDVVIDVAWIEQRSWRMLRGLEQAGYDVVRPDGTFFLYLAVPAGDDFAFAETLAREGVLVMPSSLFHQRGYCRLSVTATDTMIDVALGKLAQLQRVVA
jgi:aspartate aminotransferase